MPSVRCGGMRRLRLPTALVLILGLSTLLYPYANSVKLESADDGFGDLSFDDSTDDPKESFDDAAASISKHDDDAPVLDFASDDFNAVDSGKKDETEDDEDCDDSDDSDDNAEEDADSWLISSDSSGEEGDSNMVLLDFGDSFLETEWSLGGNPFVSSVDDTIDSVDESADESSLVDPYGDIDGAYHNAETPKHKLDDGKDDWAGEIVSSVGDAEADAKETTNMLRGLEGSQETLGKGAADDIISEMEEESADSKNLFGKDYSEHTSGNGDSDQWNFSAPSACGAESLIQIGESSLPGSASPVHAHRGAALLQVAETLMEPSFRVKFCWKGGKAPPPVKIETPKKMPKQAPPPPQKVDIPVAPEPVVPPLPFKATAPPEPPQPPPVKVEDFKPAEIMAAKEELEPEQPTAEEPPTPPPPAPLKKPAPPPPPPPAPVVNVTCPKCENHTKPEEPEPEMPPPVLNVTAPENNTMPENNTLPEIPVIASNDTVKVKKCKHHHIKHANVTTPANTTATPQPAPSPAPIQHNCPAQAVQKVCKVAPPPPHKCGPPPKPKCGEPVNMCKHRIPKKCMEKPKDMCHPPPPRCHPPPPPPPCPKPKRCPPPPPRKCPPPPPHPAPPPPKCDPLQAKLKELREDEEASEEAINRDHALVRDAASELREGVEEARKAKAEENVALVSGLQAKKGEALLNMMRAKTEAEKALQGAKEEAAIGVPEDIGEGAGHSKGLSTVKAGELGLKPVKLEGMSSGSLDLGTAEALKDAMGGSGNEQDAPGESFDMSLESAKAETEAAVSPELKKLQDNLRIENQKVLAGKHPHQAAAKGVSAPNAPTMADVEKEISEAISKQVDGMSRSVQRSMQTDLARVAQKTTSKIDKLNETVKKVSEQVKQANPQVASQVTDIKVESKQE